MKKIRRALISVSDKKGLEELGKTLQDLGIEILSTGGTARELSGRGIPVREASQFTGFPEMLAGRVKTLHPKVHGGILARRANKEHDRAVKNYGLEYIDMVVVNLYPFETAAAKPNVSEEELIENIDIGGPTMIRAAAKNFEDVAVVVSPDDYSTLMEELRANQGSLPRETRFRLARTAFAHTAAYDAAISTTLDRRAAPAGETTLPERLHLSPPKSGSLRPPLRRSGPGSSFCKPTSGKGAFLQQPGGPSGRLEPGHGIRSSHDDHHQAHESMRCGQRNHSGGKLPPGAGGGPGLGLRVRHGLQPQRRS